MKVALVSLAHRGGMVHFQAELAESLISITETLVVSATETSGITVQTRVPRLIVDTGRNAFGSLVRALNPFTWFSLSRKLAAADVDLLHIVGAHEWNPLVGMLIKALKKPLVYTLHDPVAHAGAPIAIRISNWLTVRLANAIVVLTEQGQEELEAQGFPSIRLYRIPHGAYSYFRRWRNRKIKPEKIILFFGRFAPYKGLHVLLTAFALVRKDLPHWRLVLAGSGKLPRLLSRADVLGIEIHNGYIGDKYVAELMQRASLVVAPYTEASQSGVVATAIAFGRPVIASDVGGLSEMVIHGKTGLLVPANNVEALAKAIKALARNPSRSALMGRNALAWGRTKWSWHRIAQEHLKMYSTVLARFQSQ